MYQDSKRTCTAIVLLIKPFVWWGSRCLRRRGFVNSLITGTGGTSDSRKYVCAHRLNPTSLPGSLMLRPHRASEETPGEFHSTKISGNSGSNSNGIQIFRKFVSKISVQLSRLSFFLEIWKFRKFPVPFGISTRFESDPVPLVLNSYKMAASLLSRHYTRCKMICHSSSLFLIKNENVNVRIWFPGKSWTGRSEFPVGLFARFVYSPARKVRKFLQETSFSLGFFHKYQGRVEFWMRVKLLHIRQLNTALKTATSLRSFSIFSSNS